MVHYNVLFAMYYVNLAFRRAKMSCIQSAVFSSSQKIYPFHAHKNVHHIIFITGGTVTVKISDKVYEITEPSLIFISNLEKHSIIPKTKNYKRYILSLYPLEVYNSIKSRQLHSIFTNRPANFAHVFNVSQNYNDFEILFKHLFHEHKSGNDLKSGDDIFLNAILISLYRYQPESFPSSIQHYSGVVMKVKNLIEQQYHVNFSLQSLAEFVHLSPYYLAHKFKEATGYSVTRYRLLFRIAAACEKLALTDKSITEICFSCGFSDMSNFSRFFKRETGFTPTEYRKSSLNSKETV